jgi:hypothetical protein
MLILTKKTDGNAITSDPIDDQPHGAISAKAQAEAEAKVEEVLKDHHLQTAIAERDRLAAEVAEAEKRIAKSPLLEARAAETPKATPTTPEPETEQDDEKERSKLKRKKSSFGRKKKASASTVEDANVDDLEYTRREIEDAVDALCQANDKIAHFTSKATKAKELLGKVAKELWYGGTGRSFRVTGAGGGGGCPEAVLSIKEKTTGKRIADEEQLEELFEESGLDVDNYFEGKSILKMDSKILDMLDTRYEDEDEPTFMDELEALAKKHGVSSAIEEEWIVQPRAGFHEERRGLTAIEGGVEALEEQVPLVVSVNTKVKRKD